jgi:hypothetical protein
LIKIEGFVHISKNPSPRGVDLGILIGAIPWNRHGPVKKKENLAKITKMSLRPEDNILKRQLGAGG